MRRLIVTLFLVLSLGMVASCKLNVNTKRSPQPWEYLATYAPDLKVADKLESLGKDGWEAVWCRRAKGAGDTWGYECLFKRPKGDD